MKRGRREVCVGGRVARPSLLSAPAKLTQPSLRPPLVPKGHQVIKKKYSRATSYNSNPRLPGSLPLLPQPFPPQSPPPFLSLPMLTGAFIPPPKPTLFHLCSFFLPDDDDDPPGSPAPAATDGELPSRDDDLDLLEPEVEGAPDEVETCREEKMEREGAGEGGGTREAGGGGGGGGGGAGGLRGRETRGVEREMGGAGGAGGAGAMGCEGANVGEAGPNDEDV